MNELFNWNPAPPSCRFQIGLGGKLGDIAETEIGQHFDRPGDPEHPLQCSVVQNADPSHPDTFSPRSQPEILDGATGAVQIRLAHRRTPQHMRAAALAAAGHTEIDRRFLDPFELQASIEGRAGPCISRGRLGIRLGEKPFHSALRRALTDDNKIPRLHEADRAGLMRRGQHPRQHILRYRRGQKVPPNIPSLENRPIDGRPLRTGKHAVAESWNIGRPTHTTLPEHKFTTIFIGCALFCTDRTDRCERNKRPVARADLFQTGRAEAVLKARGNPVHLPLGNADLPAPALVSAAFEGCAAGFTGFGHWPSHTDPP